MNETTSCILALIVVIGPFVIYGYLSDRGKNVEPKESINAHLPVRLERKMDIGKVSGAILKSLLRIESLAMGAQSDTESRILMEIGQDLEEALEEIGNGDWDMYQIASGG